MDVLSRIYASLCKDKRKERFETILEPLQAITQLALLSFCPKGSKLSITNNILFIQTPTWSQGFLRSYNQDQRDDLFFLFSVIKRFNKFYSSPVNKTHHSEHKPGAHKPGAHKTGAHKTGAHNNDSAAELFGMLIELSKSGIDNLIQTYSESDQTTLLHTLRMYRTMLDKPDAFVESASGASAIDAERDSIDDIFIKITELYSPTYIDVTSNIP